MLSPAGEAWHGEDPPCTRSASPPRGCGRRTPLRWPCLCTTPAPSWSASTPATARRSSARRRCSPATARRSRCSTDAGPGARTRPGSRQCGGCRSRSTGQSTRGAVVAALLASSGRASSPRSPSGRPDATVIATGSRLPAPYGHLVRGVRGEIVRLRGDVGLRHVRAGMGARRAGLRRPAARRRGGRRRDLRGARRAAGRDRRWRTPPAGGRHASWCPGLDRAELCEALARDRPGTPDNRPLVGPTARPRVFLAAGHFRHGVLLAPLTARLLADAVEGAAPDPALDPRRFIQED